MNIEYKAKDTINFEKIRTTEDAAEYARRLLMLIDPEDKNNNWNIALITDCITFLKKYKKRKIFDLPHLLALLNTSHIEELGKICNREQEITKDKKEFKTHYLSLKRKLSDLQFPEIYLLFKEWDPELGLKDNRCTKLKYPSFIKMHLNHLMRISACLKLTFEETQEMALKAYCRNEFCEIEREQKEYYNELLINIEEIIFEQINK